MSGQRNTSFRLSDDARLMLADLAEHYGVSMTAVLELLIRDKARKVRAKTRRTK